MRVSSLAVRSTVVLMTTATALASEPVADGVPRAAMHDRPPPHHPGHGSSFAPRVAHPSQGGRGSPASPKHVPFPPCCKR